MALNDWVPQNGIIKKILRLVKRVLDRALGTAADALFWRFRHVIDPHWDERYLADASINHPHRPLLITAISRYAPFRTALEVGCASGPNLYLLAQQFPHAELLGIDISAKAVATGNKWLKEKGVKNVVLSAGNTDYLQTLPLKSIDIIFTDALLIYIGPEKILEVLRNMLRVARRAIILNEWHTDASSLYDGHWVHNYRNLFSKLTPRSHITVTKIPQKIWGGSWATYGYIIEIDLS